jgi:hypothetical protein
VEELDAVGAGDGETALPPGLGWRVSFSFVLFFFFFLLGLLLRTGFTPNADVD